MARSGVVNAEVALWLHFDLNEDAPGPVSPALGGKVSGPVTPCCCYEALGSASMPVQGTVWETVGH